MNYDDLTKEALVEILKRRDAQAHYGLHWERHAIERDKALNRDFVGLELRPDLCVGQGPWENLLIEGDNYDALRHLATTHAAAFHLIYIDVPYNTGNRDFVYNDNFFDARNRYRHSTWLEFMYQRLALARSLLREDGAIVVSIDDNELFNLGLLMNQVFGERRFVANCIWQKRYSRENREAVGDAHEYLLIYSPNPEGFKKRRGRIPLSEDQAKIYKNPENPKETDPTKRWRGIPMTAQGYRPNQMYRITAPNGTPHDPPEGRCWSMVEPEFLALKEQGRIYWGKDGTAQPSVIRFLSEVDGLVPWTWWPHEEVGHTDEARKEIQDIFGTQTAFDTPKPLRLMERVLQICAPEKDALVLDFFAGSGTTAHAVLKMTASDDGGVEREPQGTGDLLGGGGSLHPARPSHSQASPTALRVPPGERQGSLFQVLATAGGFESALTRGYAEHTLLTEAFQLESQASGITYPLKEGAPRSLWTEQLPAIPENFEERLVSHIDFTRVLGDRLKVKTRVVERTTDLFSAPDPHDRDVWANVSAAAIADRARQIAFAFDDVDRRVLLQELKNRFRQALTDEGHEVPESEEELTRQLELVLVRNDRLIRNAYKRVRAEQVTTVTTNLPPTLPSAVPLTPAVRNIYGVFPPDMSPQELEFAELLDTAKDVEWWHRNPVRKPDSVALYGWADGVGFFPDFVVKVAHRTEGEGIALAELKGPQLQQYDRAKAAARHLRYGRVFMVGKTGAEGTFRLWRLRTKWSTFAYLRCVSRPGLHSRPAPPFKRVTGLR